MGHAVSPPTVSRLLKKNKYSLKVNRKEKDSRSQRNEQFEYIATRSVPLISVDSKKKELIGDFKNGGVSWCQANQRVNVHDFRSEAEGIAVPYGIYDVIGNEGYVCS